MTFEMNNARNDATLASGRVTENSLIVEVFSAMTQGKDLGAMANKNSVEKAEKKIRELCSKADAGDLSAIAEINQIRTYVMQPKLMQELKVLGMFGTYKQLGWGETAYLVTPKFENVKGDIQAEGQDVRTPFIKKDIKPLAPITISGGHKVNYRKMSLGNFEEELQLQEEVRKSIRNAAIAYCMKEVFNAIDNATGVKYFYEHAGLAKTGVDALLTKLRRYGKPTIFGDYALLSQFNNFVGYAEARNGVNITGVSLKALDEILDNGILGVYNGSVLKEITNPYDYTQTVTEGGELNYATLLPAGLGLVIPQGVNGISPVQPFTIGGLTSFTGNDVTTGEILTRYDLSVACGIGDTSAIGVIHDTQLDTL